MNYQIRNLSLLSSLMNPRLPFYSASSCFQNARNCSRFVVQLTGLVFQEIRDHIPPKSNNRKEMIVFWVRNYSSLFQECRKKVFKRFITIVSNQTLVFIIYYIRRTQEIKGMLDIDMIIVSMEITFDTLCSLYNGQKLRWNYQVYISNNTRC